MGSVMAGRGAISLVTGKLTGNFANSPRSGPGVQRIDERIHEFGWKFPARRNREFVRLNREFFRRNRELFQRNRESRGLEERGWRGRSQRPPICVRPNEAWNN